MKRSITRVKGDRFCTLEIELENERLSIRSVEGRIVSKANAKKEAIEYWKGFFEENPGEIQSMNTRFGKRLTSATGAARFVTQTDGDYHGLDIMSEDSSVEQNGTHVRIGESFGQQETLLEYFPEVAPLLPWHLNDMHAGCEHQEALGWGKGRTIALAWHDCTEAQRATLTAKAEAICKKAREKLFNEYKTLLTTNRNYAIRWIKSVTDDERCTEDDLRIVMAWDKGYNRPVLKKFQAKLNEQIEKQITPEPFDAKTYPDSIGAPCPTCGYEYGTEWLKRDLPPEIIELAHNVCKSEVAA